VAGRPPVLFASMLPSATSLHLSLGGVGGSLLLAALCATAIVVAVLAYRDTQPELSVTRRWLLTTLRALVLLLVIAMLAEPILLERKDVSIPPGLLLLVDNSGSMAIRSPDGTRRLDEARRLRDQVVADLGQLGGSHRVWVGEGARRLTTSRPAEAMTRSGARGVLGEGTDLPALLLSAAQRHLEDNLAAILLFSDGVSTSQSSPSLAGLGIPVYLVAVGDSLGPADVRLDRVHYPPLAYRNERVEIDAEVAATATSAGSTWTVLSRGDTPVDSTLVSWPEGGGRTTVRFEVAADSLGLRHLSLRAAPVAGETLSENNQVQIAIEVRKERLHITYVQAQPSWSFHFLARQAARDARFEFEGVHQAETGWRIAGTDSTWTPPRTVAQMRDVDLWVVGSLEDLAVFAASPAPLTAAVDAGAGLLVLAGEPARRSLPPVPGSVAGLLPLRPQSGSIWQMARFRVEPTVAGRGHPVLALAPDLGDVQARLLQMPPLWAVASQMTLAPDADVLLQADGARTDLPLLAVRSQGNGRVAVWGGSPLWSWSFWRLGSADDNEAVFQSLFGNLLYYLAEGGDRTRLRLNLPQSVLAQGQDALLRATALDRRLQPDPVHDVWLEWVPGHLSPDDSLAEASGRARMDPDPRTPGGRQLAVPALPPGEYSIRVALEEDGSRITSAWQDLVVDPYSVEFQHPQVDRGALLRIAQATRGDVLAPDELHDWPSHLALQPRQAVLSGRIDLWDSLFLFLPLLILLALEWVLRKRWGLV
jgi:hypothetical protein